MSKILHTDQPFITPIVSMDYDALVTTGTVTVKSIFERMDLHDAKMTEAQDNIKALQEDMKPLAGNNLTLLAHEVLEVCRYRALKIYPDADAEKEAAAFKWFEGIAARCDQQNIFESTSARHAGIDRQTMPSKLLQVKPRRHGVAHAANIDDLKLRCKQAKGHCKMLKRDEYYSTMAFIVKNATALLDM